MSRQLYGIGNLVGREQYGLGSSLKKFVRNIIPNEVSKVATTVAPFIAPFDPATAALMSSVGTFDQTGSISGGLKSGALTYGGGQLARYLGGAELQGNPFTSGQSLLSPSAYTDGGIMAALDPRTSKGLTMPFASKPITPVEGIDTKAAGEEISKIGQEALGKYSIPDEIYAEPTPLIERIQNMGAMDNLKNINQGNNITENAFELLKKGAEEVFYTTDKNNNRVLDKKAVFAALAGASTFIEAEKVAKDNGISLTKEQYEAAKAKKRTQYDADLANFFTTRTIAANGGRMGFNEGSKPTYKDLENFMRDKFQREKDRKKQQYMDEFEDFLNRQKPVEAANGGRIGYAEGSDKKPAIPAEDFKKILEEFMKNQEKQEKIRRENKAHGGRMKYKEAGIVSLTDEDSGVMYSDPSGKSISKEEAMNAFNQMAMQEAMEKNKIAPKAKPKALSVKGKLKGILQLAGAMEPDKGREYFDSTVLTMMDESGMKPDEVNQLIDQIQKESLNEETRITKANGTNPAEMKAPAPPAGAMVPTPEQMEKMKREIFNITNNPDILLKDDPIEVYQEYQALQQSGRMQAAQGGRMHYALGDGVMSLPIRNNGAGVQEIDYRDQGGMVPVGVKEKADDVPAMLSKNEFVVTADAVRGIGNGSVENGAEKLYNMMKHYEQRGQIV